MEEEEEEEMGVPSPLPPPPPPSPPPLPIGQQTAPPRNPSCCTMGEGSEDPDMLPIDARMEHPGTGTTGVASPKVKALACAIVVETKQSSFQPNPLVDNAGRASCELFATANTEYFKPRKVRRTCSQWRK
jgi:hypothetical protein